MTAERDDFSLDESIRRLTGETQPEKCGHVFSVLDASGLREFVRVGLDGFFPIGRYIASRMKREREYQAEIERLREQVAFYRGCAEAAAEQECTG